MDKSGASKARCWLSAPEPSTRLVFLLSRDWLRVDYNHEHYWTSMRSRGRGWERNNEKTDRFPRSAVDDVERRQVPLSTTSTSLIHRAFPLLLRNLSEFAPTCHYPAPAKLQGKQNKGQEPGMQKEGQDAVAVEQAGRSATLSRQADGHGAAAVSKPRPCTCTSAKGLE